MGNEATTIFLPQSHRQPKPVLRIVSVFRIHSTAAEHVAERDVLARSHLQRDHLVVVGVVRENPSLVTTVHSLEPPFDQIPNLSFALVDQSLHPSLWRGSVRSMCGLGWSSKLIVPRRGHESGRCLTTWRTQISPTVRHHEPMVLRRLSVPASCDLAPPTDPGASRPAEWMSSADINAVISKRGVGEEVFQAMPT